MDTKKLMSNTILYGLGDVIVIAVSGFFMIPFLTRVLPQTDYGIYVVTRANSDIFIYILHFGLISAVSRLFFEYRKKGEHYQYLSSVVLHFLCIATFCGLLAILWGRSFWWILSPTVPFSPYFWFCIAVSFLNFFAYLSAIWFRVEERALSFILVQVGSTVMFLLLVAFLLLYLHKGLFGLLLALVINAGLTGSVLAFQFGSRFSLNLKREYFIASLHYALPIVIGYCAYFLLNRISTIILQRYVSLADMAVFGLGQQLSLVITIAANAFGKSLQPVIFAAQSEDLPDIIDRSGKLYLLLVSCLVCLVLVFAPDLLRIAAPARYQSGIGVFMIMTIGNFIFTAGFIPDSILLYYKKPTTAVLASIIGGILSLVFALLLVPYFKVLGAAISTAMAFTGLLAVRVYTADQLLRNSTFWFTARLLPMMLVTAVLSLWLKDNPLGLIFSLVLKFGLAAIFIYISYSTYTSRRVEEA